LGHARGTAIARNSSPICRTDMSERVAPSLSDAVIVNELGAYGIDAVDTKGALAGTGASFQEVLRQFLQNVCKFDR
jgi:hypothetical protein